MAYLVGRLVCDVNIVPQLAEALNYLRQHGDRLSCGEGVLTGDGTHISIPVCYRGSRDYVEEKLPKILDTCQLSWNEFVPRLSRPETISMANMLDGLKPSNYLLKADDLLPDSLLDPFANVVGLKSEINAILELGTVIKAKGRRTSKLNNFAFLGEPGTGKTMLAECFAKYCKKAKINSGKFISTCAQELISNHVGETPQLTASIYKKAAGGVLFIDEIYALTQDPQGGGAGNEFGQESVNTLTQLITDNSMDVMVIVAGYPEGVEAFFEANKGLRSRFNNQIVFKGYNDDELCELYRHFAQIQEFAVHESVDSVLMSNMQLIRSSLGFAYSRTMEELVGKSVITAVLTHPGDDVLYPEDLLGGIARMNLVPEKRSVGFA